MTTTRQICQHKKFKTNEQPYSRTLVVADPKIKQDPKSEILPWKYVCKRYKRMTRNESYPEKPRMNLPLHICLALEITTATKVKKATKFLHSSIPTCETGGGGGAGG